MSSPFFSDVPSNYPINPALQQANGDQSIGNVSSLSVGAGNVAMYTDQEGLWLGRQTFADAKANTFAVDMNGNVFAPFLSVNGANIFGTLNAVTINASTINASAITGTTINSTSSINGSTITLPNESLATGNAGKLIWASGARIWGDSSGFIGINGVGGQVIIYGNSNTIVTLSDTGQANFTQGIVLSGGNFNVDAGNARFRNALITDQDNIQVGTGAQGSGGFAIFSVRNMGLTSSKDGSNNAVLDWGNGAHFAIDHASDAFSINGNVKHAIVPTSVGYRALYCVESPEVWFMDFSSGDTLEMCNPLFVEVTEGDAHFIKCENGGFQVWRRRRGHAEKRFESKTPLEFEKNESFLRMSKVI